MSLGPRIALLIREMDGYLFAAWINIATECLVLLVHQPFEGSIYFCLNGFDGLHIYLSI